MELLKKFLISVGVLALIFIAITITINVLNNNEKEKVLTTVNSAFESLKNYDVESLKSYMNTDSITTEINNIKKLGLDDATDAEKAIFKYIEYDVTVPEDMTVFDKEVIVDVKLSNKNMGEVLLKYIKDTTIYKFSTAFSLAENQEDIEKDQIDLFVQAIESENISMTELTVTLKLVKQEDNTWKIEFVNEEQFVNAIIPSFEETLINYINENSEK